MSILLMKNLVKGKLQCNDQWKMENKLKHAKKLKRIFFSRKFSFPFPHPPANIQFKKNLKNIRCIILINMKIPH